MANLHEICQKFFGDSKACSNVLMSYQQRVTRTNGGVSNLKLNQNVQFVNFIINSEEFTTYYGERFDDTKAKMFPDDENPLHELKLDFLKTQVSKKQVFAIGDLEQYLKDSAYFTNYYKDFARSVYTFYFNDDMEDVVYETVLEHIRRIEFREAGLDLNARVHAIVRDIRPITTVDSSKRPPSTAGDEHRFQNLYESRFGGLPNVHEIREFNEFMGKQSNIVDLYFEHRYRQYNIFAKQVMDHFYHVFHRDITAIELIKYYGAFAVVSPGAARASTSECVDQSHMANAIAEYHANFSTKFKTVSNIYNDFLSRPIEYDEFVKLYIDHMQTEDAEYHDSIVQVVVQYERYKTVMIDKIKNIYKNTFDVNVSQNDLDYFYECTHRDHLSLVSENLPVVISGLKEETDGFKAVIRATMQKVLQRDADIQEEISFIDYFRYNVTNVKPDIRLEDELYESLEYHDVLKTIIQEQYCKERNLQTNRSDLFKMLTHVLNMDDKLIKRNAAKVFSELDIYNSEKKSKGNV